MVGVEPAGFRERHRRPVDEYEFCHGVEFTDPDGRARGRDVLGRRAGSGEPRIQTRLEGPATLIGPCRYSIAG